MAFNDEFVWSASLHFIILTMKLWIIIFQADTAVLHEAGFHNSYSFYE